MKKILIFGALALLLFTVFYYLRHPLGTKVTIRNQEFAAELAVTAREKQKGLGGRMSLPQDAGMLFVYQNKDRYGFWMKDMQFPLDFIWIDGNLVVELTRNVPPPASPLTRPVELAPKVMVDKVFEVNAGTIDRIGIAVGDIVQFTD